MRSAILALALAIGVHTGLVAEVTVQFRSDAVIVRGVSPGGTVAFVGFEKHPGYFRAEVSYKRELLSDTDGDGAVTYSLEREAASTSVWAFVDVTSGAAAVVSPDGEAFREVESPFGDPFSHDGAEVVLMDDARRELDLLYVRPAVGAWQFLASDGNSEDRDGSSNGRLRVHLRDLREMGGGGRAVTQVLAGDVVVGLDRYKGEFFVAELTSGAGR